MTVIFFGNNEDDALDTQEDDEEPDGTSEYIEEAKKEPEEFEEADFDFSDLIPSISKTVNRIPDAGVISVINSSKGKRVSMSREVYEQLGEPASVRFGFMKEGMVIAQYLDDTCTFYELRQQGAKRIIYSKELVEQITKHCELDFKNRTSITLYSVQYQKLKGIVIAIISR